MSKILHAIEQENKAKNGNTIILYECIMCVFVPCDTHVGSLIIPHVTQSPRSVPIFISVVSAELERLAGS